VGLLSGFAGVTLFEVSGDTPSSSRISLDNHPELIRLVLAASASG
jgi:hypothetical protein